MIVVAALAGRSEAVSKFLDSAGSTTIHSRRMEEPRSPRLKEFHTRFLFPFSFDQWSVNDAVEVLQRQHFARPGGTPQPICLFNGAPGLYQDEVLDHVNRYLFRDASNTCRYLTLSGNVLNSILHHQATIELGSGVQLPFRPSRMGIELFLMTYGVGVLSIALTPVQDDLSLIEAIEFNYRLARFDPMPARNIYIPHPHDEEARAKRLESKLTSIPPPPKVDAPASERIGALGGIFTMPELISLLLLDPLRELNCRKVQQGLSTYSVARFPENIDFAEDREPAMRQFIAALAQVEEPGHAGAPLDSGLPNQVLNTKHWAAASLLGAVHLIADQPPIDGKPHPFNQQRVPRVRDKYFVPYLMALLQKLFLDRTIKEASAYMEFALAPKPREFVRELKREIEDSFFATYERVFDEAQDFEAMGLEGALNRELHAAANALFARLREAPAYGNMQELCTFLSEDIRRAITEEIERVFTESGSLTRRQVKHLTHAAITNAIGTIFSQDRHLASQLADVLQFAVRGHFVQVSSREVLHRFYRLAQEGLDVPQAWEEVNYAISNLDRKLAAERAQNIAKTTADNLVVISRVQRIIQLVEYLVIAAYSAEVFHIAMEERHRMEGWQGPVFVVVALAVGFLVVLGLERAHEAWEKRHRE